MRMIQIRNVPDEMHREIKARAALAGMSLSDYLLLELRKALDRPPAIEVLPERSQKALFVRSVVSLLPGTLGFQEADANDAAGGGIETEFLDHLSPAGLHLLLTPFHTAQAPGENLEGPSGELGPAP